VLATLAVFFGGLAALLAAVGLYGVLAYAVSRRAREIGVRMALGASRRRVVGMVLGETAAMTLTGTVAGLAAALALSRYTESLLFGVTTKDAAAFAGAAVLMLAVAALAGYLPARRAAAVDPALALRAE
jgi:ABC-type antimicrobial peptide transport system permease subunit